MSIPDRCWYRLIETALIGNGAAVEIDAEDGEDRIWRYLKSEPDIAAHPPGSAAHSRDAALPDWLMQNAAAEPQRIVPLSPSDMGDDGFGAAPATSGIDRKKAIRRGTIIHRLLQSLPGIPSERRADTARIYLQRARRDDFADTEIDDIAAQTEAILKDARFAPLFASGSRAEVPIVGRIIRDGRAPLPVSGQVDRLVVTADSVLIADYKTNHAPPRSLDEALAAYPNYVLQLALYRALLSTVYPARTMRAAIVWTETPDLMEIPSHALTAALLPLTSM